MLRNHLQIDGIIKNLLMKLRRNFERKKGISRFVIVYQVQIKEYKKNTPII